VFVLIGEGEGMFYGGLVSVISQRLKDHRRTCNNVFGRISGTKVYG
jgi:predicted GIY-YIG superfamily endonuclease